MYIGQFLKEDKLLKVEKLKAVADEMGITLSQLAIAWVLRQPNVTSALMEPASPNKSKKMLKHPE